MDFCIWECRYPRYCGTSLLWSKHSQKRLRIACVAPELPRATAVKSAEKPSRDLKGGLTPQPNYSNNVVGSSSRRRYRSENGHRTARLRVAVDVDEGAVPFQIVCWPETQQLAHKISSRPHRAPEKDLLALHKRMRHCSLGHFGLLMILTSLTALINAKTDLHLAVLGRFLHSLNKFVLEEYNLEYDICDYKQYDFASVSSYSLRCRRIY